MQSVSVIQTKNVTGILFVADTPKFKPALAKSRPEQVHANRLEESKIQERGFVEQQLKKEKEDAANKERAKNNASYDQNLRIEESKASLFSDEERGETEGSGQIKEKIQEKEVRHLTQLRRKDGTLVGEWQNLANFDEIFGIFNQRSEDAGFGRMTQSNFEQNFEIVRFKEMLEH